MIRTTQFIVGAVLLVGIEIMKVYFIMPFPGSQHANTIDLAYFIHSNIFYLRTIGILVIILPAFHFLAYGKLSVKIATGATLFFVAVVFYFFNYRFLAEKMFYQPRTKSFSNASSNKISPSNLVVAVELNGDSKAYPIQLIGYHHQVRDSIGGVPVMITYCTVCRTGRVYSPEVKGKLEKFRLVGMDHFNAMFEDETSGSWWRQVNGEAISGPMKGTYLTELPSSQMTLRSWLDLHPDSKVMQPDSSFKSEYEDLKGFDDGSIESSLEKRDSSSWKNKSWVVGVQVGFEARAYDWNDLLKANTINDTLNGTALLIALEPDSVSFHVWQRDTLSFIRNAGTLFDKQTNSRWSWSGKCIDGVFSQRTMTPVQAYQEFWHSWQTFHPQTSRYDP